MRNVPARNRDMWEPIFLLRETILPRLMMEQLHVDNFHMGPKAMVEEMRRRFRIPQIGRWARAIFRSCAICNRYSGQPYAPPPPPPLPPWRVAQGKPPFTTTGVDILGKMILRNPQRITLWERRIHEQKLTDEEGVEEKEGAEEKEEEDIEEDQDSNKKGSPWRRAERDHIG
eukprot:GHVS01005213.1.p1 GENE.GHVS01005213.1~~GHVS01005213.1.p1  ORF type:complete len:172 (+),score=28.37 GHVS01005213.1:899-1414(+)